VLKLLDQLWDSVFGLSDIDVIFSFLNNLAEVITAVNLCFSFHEQRSVSPQRFEAWSANVTFTVKYFDGFLRFYRLYLGLSWLAKAWFQTCQNFKDGWVRPLRVIGFLNFFVNLVNRFQDHHVDLHIILRFLVLIRVFVWSFIQTRFWPYYSWASVNQIR
jgi:hypothetical protein